MPDKETPSDSQMTDEQAHKVAQQYQADRAADQAEDARTDSQPVKDDPAAGR